MLTVVTIICRNYDVKYDPHYDMNTRYATLNNTILIDYGTFVSCFLQTPLALTTFVQP